MKMSNQVKEVNPYNMSFLKLLRGDKEKWGRNPTQPKTRRLMKKTYFYDWNPISK